MLDSIIYSLFSFSESLAQNGFELSGGYAAMAISLLAGMILSYLLVYVFRGIGVYVLSKRQGLSTPWLAFVPFASYIQMGKLIGKCRIFGIETKNFGVWLFASSLVVFALNLTYDLAYCFKDFLFIISQDKIPVQPISVRSLSEMELFQFLLEIFSSVFGFVNIVILVFFVVLFFRFYGGKHTLAYTLLSIFFEVTFGIFVFVCRNNDKRDYEAERRRAFEQSMRSGYYGRNGSNGGAGYNPQDERKSNPFEEFDGDDQKGETSGSSQDDVFSDYPDKKNDGKSDGDLS